ncbi:MAG: hypothetical protein WC444_03470 [Candidatus Paceibacterota bacterium]
MEPEPRPAHQEKSVNRLEPMEAKKIRDARSRISHTYETVGSSEEDLEKLTTEEKNVFYEAELTAAQADLKSLKEFQDFYVKTLNYLPADDKNSLLAFEENLKHGLLDTQRKWIVSYPEGDLQEMKDGVDEEIETICKNPSQIRARLFDKIEAYTFSVDSISRRIETIEASLKGLRG